MCTAPQTFSVLHKHCRANWLLFSLCLDHGLLKYHVTAAFKNICQCILGLCEPQGEKKRHSLNTCSSKNTTVNYLISVQKPTDRISYPPIFENLIYTIYIELNLTLECEKHYN